MIELRLGSAHELCVRHCAYRLCEVDARAVVFFNAVLRVLDRIDSVELLDTNGELVSVALPATLDVLPVEGPEPDMLLEPWLTEAGSVLLSRDLDSADMRYAQGVIDPDRLCPACKKAELYVEVRENWTRLIWQCSNHECRFERPA